ncbi:MAG TPA: hypothetical protein VGN35_05825 [Jatrophihabitantaceae bacterium]|jgi:hypothetical protein|nr:hypothetical protein [Jatrophihabitantaceae bacterium]
MLFVVGGTAWSESANASSSACVTFDSRTSTAAYVVMGQQDCHEAVAGGSREKSSPSIVRWIDCGGRGDGETTTVGGGPCLQVAAACAGKPTQGGAPKTTTLAEVEIGRDGSQRLVSITCDAPVGARGGITPAAIRAEAQKRVPHPRVGVAPPGGTTLVNIQTLLWVDTPADLDLGTVVLLGQPVGLRVHVHHVAWTFGDGHSGVTTTPGRRYDPADPCRTAGCPGYDGHVYATTGRVSISAQVTWIGEYRVGTGAWQPIAGTVTGIGQSVTIAVREARGVLVPNDTGR